LLSASIVTHYRRLFHGQSEVVFDTVATRLVILQLSNLWCTFVAKLIAPKRSVKLFLDIYTALHCHWCHHIVQWWLKWASWAWQFNLRLSTWWAWPKPGLCAGSRHP
jgi:hypothetical protein